MAHSKVEETVDQNERDTEKKEEKESTPEIVVDGEMVLEPKFVDYGSIHPTADVPQLQQHNSSHALLSPRSVLSLPPLDDEEPPNTSKGTNMTQGDLYQRQPLLPNPGKSDKWGHDAHNSSGQEYYEDEDDIIQKTNESNGVIKINMPPPIREEPRFPQERWKTLLEKALQAERRKLARLDQENNLARQQIFEEYAKSEFEIFNLAGLKFHTFRHTKIKFSFHPASITNFVNQNVRFYISLKYAGKHWRLKRDSLPANFKWRIYSLFYGRNFFEIDDENILSTLLKIYELMVLWTQKEEQYRVDKFQRFKEGEDVELDSDDEQFFLSQSERNERLYKKTKILSRMIPPHPRT